MDFQCKMIHIKDFKGYAVKAFLDWMMGFEDLLDLCHDFAMLAEMFMFADFYDIQRHE